MRFNLKNGVKIVEKYVRSEVLQQLYSSWFEAKEGNTSASKYYLFLIVYLLLFGFVESIGYQANGFSAHEALPVVVDSSKNAEAQLPARNPDMQSQPIRGNLWVEYCSEQ